MLEEKSDKSTGHNYTTVYDYLFKDFRDKNINLVEIGLGTNNPTIPSNMSINGTPKESVRGWARYFKNSIIHGCDVDKGILQDEERIKTYFIDQLNLDTIKDFKHTVTKNNYDFKFDVIIDDGLHTDEANINLFKNLNDLLKINGLYIIEDLNKEVNENVLKFLENYREYFIIDQITIPHANEHDNRMVILKKKKDLLSFENFKDFCDFPINKYLNYETYKKNHNKQKVFSLSLFNNNVDQDEEDIINNISGKPNENFEIKYKKSLIKLIKIINKTEYGINLFCDKKYRNLINDKNVNVYSFDHSFGAIGMYWRFLSVDLVEESIICDIDLNNIETHKLFFNINSSCRLLSHGKNNYYVDNDKTAKKYTSILGSTIKLLKKDFNGLMKDNILKFLYEQKYNFNEIRNIYNANCGHMKNGFGNNIFNYGSDERFLNKIVFPHLVKNGSLTTFYNDCNNYENFEDLAYCKKYNNNIILL
tara:strand:- start:117 stop:1547 length:1431 start_codon:yes stop_codon:yes gene_type:complete